MTKVRTIGAGAVLLAALLAGCGELEEAIDEAAEEISTQQTEEASEPEAPEPEAPAMTVAQENAVRAAESYLETQGFSRSGLITQLEFEGFTKKQAAFAVDHVDPSWKEQAARSAEAYLETQAFSRQGLIDQLEFEGYTTAQAKYGATEAGL